MQDLDIDHSAGLGLVQKIARKMSVQIPKLEERPSDAGKTDDSLIRYALGLPPLST